MRIKTFKTIMVAGCLAGTVLLGGCSSVSFDDLYKSAMSEQTAENGKEEKKEKEKERKNDGYEMKYSGKIEGKASDIIVTSGDGKVVARGSGSYEWVTETLVKVTYDAKENDKEKVVLADQSNVTITMLDVKEEDKKSTVSEILEDRENDKKESKNR